MAADNAKRWHGRMAPARPYPDSPGSHGRALWRNHYRGNIALRAGPIAERFFFHEQLGDVANNAMAPAFRESCRGVITRLWRH
jgi:hypothetical protein